MSRALMLSFVVLFAGAALADEVQYQFRSTEDPAFPPDPAICDQAPFRVNVQLGASLWSQVVRLRDGKVVVDQARRIGRATACVQLTNFTFPPGLAQNFYAVFDLPSGRYEANGTCTLVSNDVPTGGLVLAGCNLKIVSGPPGVEGGVITSASVFNPAQLPGFATGSLWTVQAYTNGTQPAWHRGWSEGWHDDQRSDEQIEQHRQRTGH